jgi:aryl carrier-like protein
VFAPLTGIAVAPDGLRAHAALAADTEVSAVSGCLQLPLALLPLDGTVLLSRIGYQRGIGVGAVTCRATFTSATEADATLHDESGAVLLEARGIVFSRITSNLVQGRQTRARPDDVPALLAETVMAVLVLVDPPDPAASLFEYGMDSLTAVELRTRLAARLGVDVTVSAVLAQPTVCALGHHLAGLLRDSK